MRVTVWRHGEAEAAVTDATRPLTPRGRDSVREAAGAYAVQMAALGTPAGVCWHSPLVRAVETAELIADTVGGFEPQVCDALAPGTSVAAHDRFLPDIDDHFILVSHQPFVSALLTRWLDDESLPFLLPGGYACVDLVAPARGGATLVTAVPALF